MRNHIVTGSFLLLLQSWRLPAEMSLFLLWPRLLSSYVCQPRTKDQSGPGPRISQLKPLGDSTKNNASFLYHSLQDIFYRLQKDTRQRTIYKCEKCPWKTKMILWFVHPGPTIHCLWRGRQAEIQNWCVPGSGNYQTKLVDSSTAM